MAIREFQGKYRFLSNFFPSPVAMDGKEYPSVEHAYQAAKTLDKDRREVIRQQETPGRAKRAGQRAPLRKDWDEVKLRVMEILVRRKFKSHDNLKKRLLATGDEELIEGNTWRDYFWGVCNGRGENMLGKLLMELRAALQKEQAYT